MATNSRVWQDNNIANAVKSIAVDTRAMAGTATCGNTTVAKFATGKCGRATRLHQSGRHAIGVAHVTGRRSRHVCWRQAADILGIDTHKRRRRYTGTVADGTRHRCTGVVEQRTRKFRAICYGCIGNTGVGTHVAGFAALRAHADVITRGRYDGWHHKTTVVLGGIGTAVALCTVVRCRWRIGVDGRDSRHDTVVR